MFAIPRFCTLDGAASRTSNVEGVTLRNLKACDTLYVRTNNHDYEIFLLDPDSGRALVKGGKYLVEPTEATIVGSTFGGCMLKVGWLGLGMRMEILAGGQYLATTPLESLCVARAGPDAYSRFNSAATVLSNVSAV